MDVTIYTSDPDAVDPERIAELLEADNFFVRSVVINSGERSWYDVEVTATSDPKALPVGTTYEFGY